MPRGGDYIPLPDVENRNNNEARPGEQVASSARGTTSAASSATGGGGRGENLPIAELQGGASFTVPAPEGGPGSKQEGSKGKSTGARHAEEAAGNTGEGGKGRADFAGGLPTTEGVFVGSPLEQTSLYSSRGGGGQGQQATVILSGPPAYGPPPYGSSRRATAPSTVVTSSEFGPTPSRTVVLLNNPGFGDWGRGPQVFTCRACRFSGYSSTSQDPCSTGPLLAAACCCLVGLWPCSFIPFLVPDLRDTVHRCPNCHMTVGRSRQC